MRLQAIKINTNAHTYAIYMENYWHARKLHIKQSFIGQYFLADILRTWVHMCVCGSY